MLIRALLAVPSADLRRRLDQLLRRQGVETTALTSRQSLWERLTHEDYDVVFVAPPLLPDPPEPLVASIRSLPEHPEVIVLRPTENAEERARLLGAGCMAVLWQGLTDAVLGQTVHTLLDRRRDDSRHRAGVPQERTTLSDFVYTSGAMQQFMRVARRVVPTHSTLLILGETGSGKEWLARAIHAEGPRSAGPFIPVNCGALPEHLLESELFGHEEGAFTGATRARRGYFELAHQGTLFLDEIGDVPTHLQVKLLRVLEERRLVRLGGERAIRVDVRIMAATNRDLAAEIKAGRFRMDLYYRLAVVALTLPPLRERGEDIPALVESYLRHFSFALKKHVMTVTPHALAALVAYAWPGNVRELINVVERAVLLSAGPAIDLHDLPEAIAGVRPSTARRGWPDEGAAAVDRPFLEARDAVVVAFERDYLAALLAATHGRVGEAARRAGLNARSVYAMMRRHGLRKEQFKVEPSVGPS